MKRLSISSFFLAAACTLSAQNVGIGTNSPQNNLHVFGTSDVVTKVETSGPNNQAALFLKTGGGYSDMLEVQKWVAGASGYIGAMPLSNMSTVVAGDGAGPLTLGTLTNSSFHIITNNIERLRITSAGNVGIGVTNPAFKLDINGRTRIRYNTETAGIWFNNSANTSSPGFVGMYDNNRIGFYGSTAGWSLLMNVNTGNVSIGPVFPNDSKLKVENSGGNAVEISGGIKVSGSAPAAFQVTVDSSNLTDYRNSGNLFQGVIIDNTLCNGDPNALIFITALSYPAVPIRVYYDIAINKWKIKTDEDTRTVGFMSFHYMTCDRGCAATGSLAEAEDYLGFQPGNKFNVLVIKR